MELFVYIYAYNQWHEGAVHQWYINPHKNINR